MAVAWRNASLRLHNHFSLPYWTIRPQDVILGQPMSIPIPVQAWLAALPVLRAVVAQRQQEGRAETDEERRNMQQLRQWVTEPQPTTQMLVRRDEHDRLFVVDNAAAHGSAGVEHIEVLRDITWPDTIRVVPRQRDVEVHCRLVLQACPYLQHLHLQIDAWQYVEPSHEDTFALVPRLRSLRLTQRDVNQVEPELAISDEPVDFERMLDSLPCLTALDCEQIYICLGDLLAIASHSTLEQLRLEASGLHLANKEWLGDELRVPITAEEDESRLNNMAENMMVDGTIEVAAAEEEEKEVSADDTLTRSSIEGAPVWTDEDMQHMQTALSRTQPTRRSCETRLALARWLHRRLRRGGLHISGQQQSMWLLRHYRRQVALLHRVLRWQLDELAAAEAVRAAEGALDEPLSRLQQLYEQLRERQSAHANAVLRRIRVSSELKAMQKQLDERHDRMGATEHSLLTIHIARMAQEVGAQRLVADELDLRMQLLTRQAVGMLRAETAVQEQVDAQFEALLAQVLRSDMHHRQWMQEEMKKSTDESTAQTP